VIVGIRLQFGRVDRNGTQKNVFFKEGQRGHRAVFALDFQTGKIETRMKLIDRAAIGQRKTGDAFARFDAPGGETLCISTSNMSGGRITFQFVIKINSTGVKGHYVTHFVDQYFHRVLYVER
jgi:hypothetical protein